MSNRKGVARGGTRGTDWVPVYLNDTHIATLHANGKAWRDRWDDISRVLADYADETYGREFNDGRSLTARRCAAIDRLLELRGLDPKTWTLNANNAKLDGKHKGSTDAPGFYITMPEVQADKL